MAGKRRSQPNEESAAPAGKAQQSAAQADGVPRETQHHAEPVECLGQDSQLVALHRSKCWEWTPSAVVALAACPQTTMLAVGLESGDIQLWDLNFMVCLQTVVGFGTELTALAWAKDSLDGSWRTIAAALDGSLAEVSWKQGRLVATSDSGAGAVWSLVAQPAETVRPGFAHQLAAGCDDGSVRVFGVESGEPGVLYERSLIHLQGRVLALCWHPSGKSLVVGGTDGCIHALDPTTGVETMRITVGASTSQPVCVWRLVVLPDGTIVSGDSGGAVNFWDGRFGTLLQRFATHLADILALTASPSGMHVWASGIDSKVAMFERSQAQSTGGPANAQWVSTHHKRPHTHQVRALEVVHMGEGRHWLVSGGADAQLLVYPASASFLSVHPARLTKAPQSPVCSLAAGPQQHQPQQTQQQHRSRRAAAAATPAQVPGMCRLLCANRDTLDVWQVGATALTDGAAAQGAAAEGRVVELTAAPRHLARIRAGVGCRVSTADLAPSGGFAAAAVGSHGTVRVYHVGEGQQGAEGAGTLDPPSVQRLPLAAPMSSATALCLSDSHLFVAQGTGIVSALQLPESAGLQGASAPTEAVEQQVAVVAKCSAWEPEDGRTASKHTLPSAKSALRHRTWHDFTPSISCMRVSPNGLVAAAGSHGISFLKLQAPISGHAATTTSLQRAGALVRLPHDAPVTAMCFSPDGSLLAVTLASAHLVVIDVAARRPTDWSMQNEAAVAACLVRLPGALSGLTFARSSSQVLVHSPGGFCVLDLSRPVDINMGSPSKRRRGAAKPKGGPQQVAGAGPVVDQAAGAKQVVQSATPQRAGVNGRAVLLPDPVAFVGYLGPQEVLLLEKPWEDVLATFEKPLYRHTYGQ